MKLYLLLYHIILKHISVIVVMWYVWKTCLTMMLITTIKWWHISTYKMFVHHQYLSLACCNNLYVRPNQYFSYANFSTSQPVTTHGFVINASKNYACIGKFTREPLVNDVLVMVWPIIGSVPTALMGVCIYVVVVLVGIPLRLHWGYELFDLTYTRMYIYIYTHIYTHIHTYAHSEVCAASDFEPRLDSLLKKVKIQ